MSTYRISPNYLKAGEISRDVKKDVETRDWQGKLYSELCEFVENDIHSRGGSPAFPCNVCANEVAAHYSAEIDDKKIIPEGCLLKVDIGVHVEGFIADTAVTICYDDDLFELAEATKFALAEALKVVRAGTRTSDVGRVVESYAARRGFLPISNLSGHSLEQYVVHAGTSIPNVWSQSSSFFKENKVYAIEPFFTTSDGSGIVSEGKAENIFGIVARKKTKDRELDRLLESIWNRCKTLPFSPRWFVEEFPKSRLMAAILKLTDMKLLRGYPELVETKGKPVAQAEHTIAITSSGFAVLT